MSKEKFAYREWMDFEVKRPEPYDLLLLKTDLESKPRPGWWTGSGFMGLRIDPSEKFQYWKKVSPL